MICWKGELWDSSLGMLGAGKQHSEEAVLFSKSKVLKYRICWLHSKQRFNTRVLFLYFNQFCNYLTLLFRLKHRTLNISTSTTAGNYKNEAERATFIHSKYFPGLPHIFLCPDLFSRHFFGQGVRVFLCSSRQ